MKVTWVPGHSNIISNDVSDRLAKCSAADTPMSPGLSQWLLQQIQWDHPTSNNVMDYTIANTIPPTLGPTKILCKLDHKTFSCILQCRNWTCPYWQLLQPYGH